MKIDTPAPPAVLDHQDGPPTQVRYGVLTYLCSLAFILYIDRVCISMAGPRMQKELDLSDTELSYVFGAFTIAYGLFEIPTGRWGDRYGSRGVLTRIVLWWSAFTALTGCVGKFSFDSGYRLSIPRLWVDVPLLFDSFVALLVVRFLFGAGEAGALPNIARVLGRWFPPDRRGVAQGFINTCMLIGAAFTPFAVVKIMEVLDWRWTFGLFGSLGVVWAIAFYLWFRDDPHTHPWVNRAERRLIAPGTAPAAPTDHHAPVPWREVLADRNVWLLGTVVTCTAFTAYLYYSWYPKYLQSGRGVSERDSGILSTVVLLGGAVGCTAGGFLIDWLVRRTGNRRWSRRAVGCGGLSLAGLMLFLCIRIDDPKWAAGVTSLASLFAGSTMASWWGAVTEIGGRHPGAIFGLMNSLGVPGAFASQIFVGKFADWMKHRGYSGREQWDPIFYVFSAVIWTGAFLWLFIDTTRPVADPVKEASCNA